MTGASDDLSLDTSVALAHLLAEDRHPPEELWQETIVSSRLLEYELWTGIHALRLGSSQREAVLSLLGRIAFPELIQDVVSRAREAFPVEAWTVVRSTSPHSIFLREQMQDVALASYDQRMLSAARRLEFPIHLLG